MGLQARVGIDLVATGIITGPGAPTVLVNGAPASVVGDTVAPHGPPPHSNPIIVVGAATVLAQSRPVTITGRSIASCGHPVSTGAVTVFVE